MAVYVLVHGAGTGGWLWDDVAPRLRAAGHEVHAPTLAGVGDDIDAADATTDVSTHVRQIVRLIESADLRSVVLVGMSYGGFVVTGVADEVPDRLSRLVHLDAFVPRPGRSFFDLLPEPVRQAMESAAERFGDGLRIPPAPVETVGGVGALEPGVDPAHVASMLARRGAHPIGTYREAMPADVGQRGAAVPRGFILCTDKPAGDPLVAQAAGLRSDGWQVAELPTGHFAMISMPAALTGLLAR